MQQLLKRYKKYHPDPDVELIKRAYNLAELTYFGENRISGESWLDHSLAVAREVAVLRMDTATICAALLYDTYRFGLTSEELAEEVSEEVANLVDGVDALRRLTVKHRPDLKDKVYSEYLRRLVLFTSKDLRVVVLRLSEKFVGLKTLKYLDEETQNKLLDKAIHIYAPLADLIGIGMLRNGIQDRYFSFSDPKMYKESKKIIRAHPYAVPKKMTQFIKGLKEAIDNHNASIDEIFWRIKKPYSFTKKAEHYVQKYDCSYEQACNRIKDKVAITIIAPTLEQCYRSLDAIHQNFDYIPEDFDALYSEFETVLAAQGMTLEQVLELQGQTVEEFNRNLVLQIKLNKIVEAETDLTVTDEEIQDYIANSGGEEVDFTEEDIDQLKVAISDQKLQQAVQDWISSLEEDAEITQYINF